MKTYITLIFMLMLQLLHAKEHLKPTTLYYQKLADQCQGSSCCLSSLDNLIAGNYTLVPKNRICPKGYHANMYKCIDSYAWCQKD
jgi:hypothetical protein